MADEEIVAKSAALMNTQLGEIASNWSRPSDAHRRLGCMRM
jgi:hypothetical protein